MLYQVTILRTAQKQLKKIPVQNRGKIITAIESLTQKPRPSSCKKLTGRSAWRLRVGNYRIIYEINDNELIICIIAIGHRKSIYSH